MACHPAPRDYLPSVMTSSQLGPQEIETEIYEMMAILSSLHALKWI